MTPDPPAGAVYGVNTDEWQGWPPQTLTTLPSGCQKSDICSCAAGVLRGSSCGSMLFAALTGAMLASGGGCTRPGPESQISSAEPPNGYRLIVGSPSNRLTSWVRPASSAGR